ncbi:iron-sulfur flavoprotein [Lachnospiraceae bacterium KM106-2]|nr:iron-sulfur flavoprotein [Lachnospiraceae bacterium KM106-2]
MGQLKKNKTLAILGGPHKNGVTAKMLEIAMKASKDRGDEVEILYLYEKEIQFCKGCRKCLETKQCVIKDDIVGIVDAIKKSDTIILATPVYWANVPAAVKNLFDRLLGVAMEETKTFPKPRLSGRNYVLLTACNTAMPFAKIFGQSTGAIRAMKEFFKTSGMRCKGIAVCGNTSNKKEVPAKVKCKIERFFR